MFTHQKGISTVATIVILALAAILILWLWPGDTKRTEAPNNTTNEEVVEGHEDSFEQIISRAPSIDLADVSNSWAEGEAWLAVHDGRTYHRVRAQNMPALEGEMFYEGWLVKNPATGDFFSTGKLNFDPTTGVATLNFEREGDFSDYRFVVITSEPDDGNPAPDKHIIEERFGADIDLNVE